MRVRRTAALFASAVALTACGQGEPAPEFGAPAPVEEPATTTVEPAGVDVAHTALVGQGVGELAPPRQGQPVEPVTPAGDVGGDPAVQAICDRTAIFLVTAGGITPHPTSDDLTMLDSSVSQLLEDGSLLYGALSEADVQRLTGCLDQAVEAVR